MYYLDCCEALVPILIKRAEELGYRSISCKKGSKYVLYDDGSSGATNHILYQSQKIDLIDFLNTDKYRYTKPIKDIEVGCHKFKFDRTTRKWTSGDIKLSKVKLTNMKNHLIDFCLLTGHSVCFLVDGTTVKIDEKLLNKALEAFEL